MADRHLVGDAQTLSTRLIGAIFVQRGFITEEQLEEALALQETTGERLGEILVERFGIPRLELASALAEQWADLERHPRTDEIPVATERTPDAPVIDSGASAERRPIGEIFLERGFVTTDELDRALDTQRESGARLGEVLVAQGAISRLELASALAEQWSSLQKIRPPAPKAAPEAWPETALREASGSATASADTDELRSTISVLHERLEQMAADGRVDAALADLRRSLDAVVHRIDTLESTVAVEPAPDPRLDAVGEQGARIGALEVGLQGIGDRVEHLDRQSATTLDEVRAEVAGLSEKIDALATDPALLERLDALAGQTGEVRAELGSLAGRTGEMQAEIASLGSRVDELAATVPLSEAVDELRQRLEEATRGVAGTDLVAALEARLDDLVSRTVAPETFHELRARLDEAVLAPDLASADRLAEISERLEALASAAELDAIRERIEELAARADALEVDALTELRARIAELGERPTGDPELRARVEDLAERLPHSVSSDELDAVRSLLEEHAARAARPNPELTARLDELAARLEELAARPVVELPSSAPVDELTQRVVATADELDAIRAAMEALTARPVGDPDLASRVHDLAQRIEDVASRAEAGASLVGRLEELAGRVSSMVDPAELSALAERVAEVEQRPIGDPSLIARVDELAARPLTESWVAERIDALQDALGAVQPHDPERIATFDSLLAELSSRIDRVAEVTSTSIDTAAIDSAIDALRAEIADRLDVLARNAARGEDVDAIRGALETARVDAARVEELAEELATLRERAATAEALAEAERRLAASLEEERGRHGALESRLDEADARLASLDALAGRIDETEAALRVELNESMGGERDARGALETSVERLRRRLATEARTAAGRLDALEQSASATRELGQRLDEVQGTLDAIPRREELESRFEQGDAQLTGVRAELTGLRDDLDSRLAEAAAVLDERLARAVGSDELSALVDALNGRIDAVADAVERATNDTELAQLRTDLERRLHELEERVTRAHDDGATRVELTALAGDVAARIEHAEGRIARADEAIAASVARIEHVETESLARVADTVTAVERLGTTFEEKLSGVGAELDAARVADEARHASVESALGELRSEQSMTSRTLDEVVAGVGAREEQMAEALERLSADLAELRAARANDEERRAVEVAELGARIEDLSGRIAQEAGRAAESATQLRSEIERAAGSVGWRLEQVEASLASDDREALRGELERLAAQVEAERERHEEQARATERAVRKGLAGLGERLVATEESYLEAGTALRRSIERLGAAVVEADARIAGAPLDPPSAGFVAFAPTADGYRLVALDGAAPQVGETIELPQFGGGTLVATRHGASPLPLDRRTCVYLELPAGSGV